MCKNKCNYFIKINKDNPLKNDLYVNRCRKNNCNYFIKIDKDNIDKILKKDNDINFIEINIHQDHDLNDGELYETVDHKNARSEKENLKLAISLIKNNITEDLEFHYNNFYKNKIYWKKSKISKIVYNLSEEKFPKEDIFLNSIKNIKIKLIDVENTEESFCPFKGEFINYRKNKREEKYIAFFSEFQLKFYENISELFIDGTFKVSPKNWFQLLNIFGYDKQKNFYMPLSYIIMNSKTEENYNKVFSELVSLIKSNTSRKNFNDIKIMCDFEVSLRKAIKQNFEGCLLDGCYFHYAKSIWKKIRKLKLFKKK